MCTAAVHLPCPSSSIRSRDAARQPWRRVAPRCNRGPSPITDPFPPGRVARRTKASCLLHQRRRIAAHPSHGHAATRRRVKATLALNHTTARQCKPPPRLDLLESPQRASAPDVTVGDRNDGRASRWTAAIRRLRAGRSPAPTPRGDDGCCRTQLPHPQRPDYQVRFPTIRDRPKYNENITIRAGCGALGYFFLGWAIKVPESPGEHRVWRRPLD